MKTLRFDGTERPIIAQIWGFDPEKFYLAAKIIKKLKFDGIDINMGCPDKNAIKNGACSALIKNPKLAVEIIRATTAGSGGLPVSVKTRIGFGTVDTETWVKTLLQTPLSALTLHLRTVSDMSKHPARWEEMRVAIKVKNDLKSKTLIIGNGDINSLEEAREKCKEYGMDGAMIGRGIFENVWFFNPEIEPDAQMRISLLQSHLKLFKKVWGNDKHFEIMKKFVKCYVRDFPHALEVREKLMETKTLDDLIYAAEGLT